MPLYDCKCKGCGNVAEFILDRDEGTPPCPACDGELGKLEVQVGHSFQLKGGGWAEDNYSSHLGDAVKNGGGIRNG